MQNHKYTFQKDQPNINSYVNQVISLENISFNKFTNLNLDNLKYHVKKNPVIQNKKSDPLISQYDRFKFSNQESISENPLSNTHSNLLCKESNNQDNQDDTNFESHGDNKVLKYKIEALESRIKYLREKNYDLKNKVNDQVNTETFDFEEDYTQQKQNQFYHQPREVDYLKSLYDHVMIQYKQLDKNMNFLTKENQHNKKQISQLKKIVNTQNQEIKQLKKKLFVQENLIQQNQQDYLQLLDTLNRRNKEEQNLLQKIKSLQQKQSDSNYGRSSDLDLNNKSNRNVRNKNLYKRKILKVKIEKLKNSELDSLQDTIKSSDEEEKDIPFLQVLNMKKKNLQILKGRHSLGNQTTKKIIERKTCHPFGEQNSVLSSYYSKDFSQFNFLLHEFFLILIQTKQLQQQWKNNKHQLYQVSQQTNQNNVQNIAKQISKKQIQLKKKLTALKVVQKDCPYFLKNDFQNIKQLI